MKFLNRKIFVMLGAAVLVVAALPANAGGVRFQVPQAAGQPFELEAHHQPLADILGIIANTAAITLHYAGLNSAPTTAKCQAHNVGQILQCLLNGQADLVLRYGQNGNAALEEVWIHGVESQGQLKNNVMTVAAPGQNSDNAGLAKSQGAADIQQLIDQTQSGDAESRARAIAALALQPSLDRPSIRKALLNALADSAPEVRAQAVFALAQSQDAEAAAGLASAMLDKAASVRLMAVGSADNHPDLLQQALNDRDGAVSSLAAAKLADLAAE